MFRNFRDRQPIVVRAVIAIAIVAGLRIGVLLGWIPQEWTISEDQVQDWIDAAVGLLAMWSARGKVTPVADPRNSAGEYLIPAPSRPRQM